MALREADKANFQTMQDAMINGDLGIMECTDAESGEYRAVLVMRQQHKDGQIDMIPVACMAWDNPYKLWVPPKTPSMNN